MEFEKLARLLRPLMPDEVSHWLRVRDSADPETRSLIEKHMTAVAHRELGDFRNKILLSLPPEKRVKRGIELGTVLYEKDKWTAGLKPSELLQNLAIFGRSGAGKTNVVFHILEQLTAKRIPWLFLDWKRTGRHLIPLIPRPIHVYTPGRMLLPFPFNPFIAPPGLEPHVYMDHVIDALSEAFGLGDGSRSVLQKSLSICIDSGNDAPSVAQVLEELDRLPARERIHGWKISARRALESIDLRDLRQTSAEAQRQLASRLLRQNSVLELNGLPQGAKKFMVPLLCQWLFNVKLASQRREKLDFVIVIEEAHHMLYRNEQRSKEGLMNTLLRQLREMGIGVIIVDQHPHLIASAALGNAYTSICLNLKDPADVSKAARMSLIENSDKGYFGMLPVGHGIVKLQDRWAKPFLVRFPHVPVPKGLVTDRDLVALSGRSGASATDSGGIRPSDGAWRQIRGIRLWDMDLNEEMLGFLADVVESPDDGVRERYLRLGLSGDKGTRLKERLIRAGWLEAERVPIGQSRKVLLRLSTKAREVLGVSEDAQVNRASLAHEYWKRWYARSFHEKGYSVTLESPRVGGNVDVLATKDHEQIGIEIETGKSDVVSNVRNCLASGFERVIVVVTSKRALESIKKKLTNAGLEGEKRLKVVVQHQISLKGAVRF